MKDLNEKNCTVIFRDCNARVPIVSQETGQQYLISKTVSVWKYCNTSLENLNMFSTRSLLTLGTFHPSLIHQKKKKAKKKNKSRDNKDIQGELELMNTEVQWNT